MMNEALFFLSFLIPIIVISIIFKYHCRTYRGGHSSSRRQSELLERNENQNRAYTIENALVEIRAQQNRMNLSNRDPFEAAHLPPPFSECIVKDPTLPTYTEVMEQKIAENRVYASIDQHSFSTNR